MHFVWAILGIRTGNTCVFQKKERKRNKNEMLLRRRVWWNLSITFRFVEQWWSSFVYSSLSMRLHSSMLYFIYCQRHLWIFKLSYCIMLLLYIWRVSVPSDRSPFDAASSYVRLIAPAIEKLNNLKILLRVKSSSNNL